MDSWTQHKYDKPFDGQSVIYYFECVGVHRGKYEDNEYGGTYYGKSGHLTGDVTHWMPDRPGKLPLPPNKKLNGV